MSLNLSLNLVDHFSLIEKLTRRGIQFISSLQEIKKTIILNKTKGKNYTINSYQDWGTGITLRNGNNQTFVSSNQLDSLGSQLSNAADLLLSLSNSKTKPHNLHFDNILKSRIDITYYNKSQEEKLDDYIQLINDISSFLDDEPFYYEIHLENSTKAKSYQSSEYKDISQIYDYIIITINMYSKKYNYSLTENIGGIKEGDLKWERIVSLLNRMKKRFSDLPKRVNIKHNKYPVVLSADTTFSLIHETIGHGVEADQIINGNSFLSGLLGFPVSSPLLTVYDDSHIPSLGWGEFDDEGMKTQGTLIIEQGVLSGYLHSISTAEQLNTHSTGNARASSYQIPPEPRQSNLYVEPRDYTLEELLESIKNGIYVGTTEQAATSIYSGDFTIEAQYGYIIENGELSNITQPLKLQGNAISTLNNIINIGRDVKPILSNCLKNGHQVYIGGLTPQMAIDSIEVS